MQVDPRAAATSVYVATPSGGELTLDPGREVVARVVAASGDGAARISLAGQVVDVVTDAALRVGDEIRLSVSQADAAGVRLAIVSPEASGTGVAVRAGAPGAAIVQELARAGVPVTPQLTRAVEAVVEQLGGGSSATRAVANLAGRDLVLSPAAAGRVAAALDLAGSLGPALSSLAARSAAVAAALPTGVPSADALRSLLAPSLSNAELAVARIVQSTQASAPGGPVTLPTPPSSSAAVIQNYVSSQVAVTGRLDQLAAQNTTLGTAELLTARGATPAAGTTGGGGSLAPAALQAALRGQAAAVLQPAADADPTVRAPLALAAPAPGGTSAGSAAAALAAGPARASATAAAATGAGAATPTPTSSPTAQAVANLATLAVRFAPAVAPATGGMASVTAASSRGMHAADAPHADQAVATTASGSSPSVAGAGSSGPAPLVTALRAFLGSGGAAGDSSQLLRTLAGADSGALAMAIRTLPEGQALRLAGQLLDLLPDTAQLSGPARGDLRHGVHAALDQLGRSLLPAASDDASAMRAVLEQVAAADPRPAVAADASRLLAAIDGQQILSRTSAGADPGYVYFQVPMPDGRGAEVLVRREPGRRQVSFDEFRVAFLLDTERLGTLMIELDAHPAGIRADIRTEVAELEPFLRARSDELAEPLAREARRPVTITTGVFEHDPPSNLLEPRLGLLEPGATEFYA